MPVAMISTSTSPCFGPSRSTSTISKGCLAAKATAARVFIFIIPQSISPAPCHRKWHGPMLKAMQGSELQGRHALITGGGTGIGAAAAAHLHAAGARLSLLGRRMEPLQRTAEELGAYALACDVTQPDQIAK